MTGGKLFSITYQPVGVAYEEGRFGDFIREPFPTAVLRAGHGLEGDQKAGHNPKRQVNVLSREWLEARKAEGYRSEPGQFGEQMVVSGIDVMALPPGTRLRIGADAVIEITKARTGCSRLQAAQSRPVECGNIGILSRVVAGGAIAVGDPVSVIVAEEAVAEAP